jgi:hypothetical protein
MDLVLQIWGGLFYLTNKICFALAEGKEKTAIKVSRGQNAHKTIN